MEFQGEIEVQTTQKTSQIQNAIYSLEKRLKVMDRDDIPDNLRGHATSFLFSLAELYRKADDDVSANSLGLQSWEEFWNFESKENSIFECYGDAHFRANFTAEASSEIEFLVLPEHTNIGNKQFHSNIEIVGEYQFKKSNKFEKPIYPQELIGYKVKNAKVQFSNYDRDMILATTDCTLHGYSNLLSARPPVGFSVE